MSDFIQTWKNTAIVNHLKYGVPASIILAQAILESNWGKSKLATQANNFFGIKAYSNPNNLPIYYATDDLVNEPFRKYPNPKESFKDHSKFLIDNPRYKKLFSYNNYWEWTKGLKNAGYATAPTYDKTLDGIIEKYRLHRFDFYGQNRTFIYLAILSILGLSIWLIRLQLKKKK